jgi:hypothetical protein
VFYYHHEHDDCCLSNLRILLLGFFFLPSWYAVFISSKIFKLFIHQCRESKPGSHTCWSSALSLSCTPAIFAFALFPRHITGFPWVLDDAALPAQIVPPLVTRNYFRLGPMFFLILKNFLVPCDVPGLSCIFPASAIESFTSSRNLAFFYWSGF